MFKSSSGKEYPITIQSSALRSQFSADCHTLIKFGALISLTNDGETICQALGLRRALRRLRGILIRQQEHAGRFAAEQGVIGARRCG